MKYQILRLLITAFVTIAIVSCSQTSQESDVPGSNDDTSANAIQWFDGSVDDAFAYAKETGKPVFLYWGAEWCPPCHAIKATVFRSAEFIDRSKLFVPVYLDGDTENAQAAGESFGVRGYPTMIVFNSNGNELTRIPGGIDIQAYANILDLTLGDLSPVAELVDGVFAQEKKLNDDDCRLLAYYSWNQSPDLLDGLDEVDLYRRIYDACSGTPQPERSILFMAYLDALIEDTDAAFGGLGLEEAQVTEALVNVNEILGDPALLRANVFSIVFDGAATTRALTDSGTEARQILIASFEQAMTQLAGDELVYKRERIYTVLGKLYLERIDDDEIALSSELQNEIRSMVSWADVSTPDPYARHAIVNAAANVLDSAGMHDIAKPLLIAEIKKSKQPYYFMESLAEIEQSSGNYDEALEWLRTAYDQSQGPATRFQWGYYYIVGLLEMTPDNVELISSTTIDVVRELEAGSGFYQRPKAQLKRLEGRLLDWGDETDQGEVIQQIRGDVLAVCDRIGGQKNSLETCQSFLDRA